MIVTNPSDMLIPQLRRLWKVAFGDEDDFLDLFFSTAFSPDRCRCIQENGQLLAAHYWFDVSFDGQKMAYLYAVATDPDHRGKGLCRALMADAQAHLTSLGYEGILLVPQDKGLRHMYRRMGFDDITTVTEFTAPPEDTDLPMRRLTAAEYELRRRAYLPEGSALQEGISIRFLSEMALFFEGTDWLAAVTLQGDVLRCQELLGNPDTAYGIVAAFGCREGHFRIPGADTPFAQGVKLSGNCHFPSYFGLAFD